MKKSIVFTIIILVTFLLSNITACSKRSVKHEDYGIIEIYSNKKIYLFQKKHNFEKYFGSIDNYLWLDSNKYDDLNVLLNDKNEINYISVGKNGLDTFMLSGTNVPLSELRIYDIEILTQSYPFRPGNRYEKKDGIEIFRNYYGYFIEVKYTKDYMPKNSFADNIQLREFYFENGKLFFYRMGPWIDFD
ncbi:MAG: hypothetical protein GY756_03600 [bacterium]|nr:hypothetical protein [bacterium]